MNVTSTNEIAAKVGKAIFDFVAKVPDSSSTPARLPALEARAVANAAAAKAAMAAGSLALPVGPIGWLTILPELIAVWRIQGRMVADIAAIYGKKAELTREHMVYCLFKHSAAQAVRDLVMRVGERWLVKEVSVSIIQSVARAIGVEMTQRAIGKTLTRWIPIAGAMGVGAYAYYDTTKVAQTAIELFSQQETVVPEKAEKAEKTETVEVVDP